MCTTCLAQFMATSESSLHKGNYYFPSFSRPRPPSSFRLTVLLLSHQNNFSGHRLSFLPLSRITHLPYGCQNNFSQTLFLSLPTPAEEPTAVMKSDAAACYVKPRTAVPFTAVLLHLFSKGPPSSSSALVSAASVGCAPSRALPSFPFESLTPYFKS